MQAVCATTTLMVTMVVVVLVHQWRAGMNFLPFYAVHTFIPILSIQTYKYRIFQLHTICLLFHEQSFDKLFEEPLTTINMRFHCL